ncbi:uncharacterized protein HMPREF1541_09779 [Cyphellophora europaea CBS 101466]|uniref:DNA polymerase delta subunit 3 n=1 Tax=Cyphellophora europaea (strain CBS 101466) TaxID=1220924 RepID=W2SAJ1_CYPE1|nr:uncharacterized protein HMPREF1541_09779 [Cyphellophora europaea CBS 101466]ETN44904.1 hypothetical protein HMPREF1541_09779 [Cyphellophora europaea CBS 101466]
MTDFKTHLASELVSEQKTVSYRTLSRAVRVHANVAKCMLFEFYEEQTKRRPGSVYATYLLSGTKRRVEAPNGITKSNGKPDEDQPMPSSPPIPSSSMVDPSQQESITAEHEDVKVRTVTLVREENLEEVKRSYEAISSIHIYSLSPGKIPDLVELTDLGRGLYTDVFAKEDPLTSNKTYGVIQNPLVRRRKGKRPIVPTAASSKFQAVKDVKPASTVKEAPKPAAKSGGIAASFNKSTPTLKKEETASRPSSRDSTSTSASKPTLKRDASDIFKAFAKGKTKKDAAKNSQDADTPMSGLGDDDDEGESEEEALFLDTGKKQAAKKRTSEVKKERDDKAAKLRKMMDSDDEETKPPISEAAAAPAEEAPAAVEAEEKDPDAVEWSESDTEATKPKRAAQEPAEPEGEKRRRGKRKVTRKRTMKDEDGYLVTKEEEVYESFSETDDEGSKPKAKQAFGGFGAKGAASQGSKGSQKPAAGGGKKAGGGGGGGSGKKDIMSFFGKK